MKKNYFNCRICDSEAYSCDHSSNSNSHCKSFKINGKLSYLPSRNRKMHKMGTLCKNNYPLTLFVGFILDFI